MSFCLKKFKEVKKADCSSVLVYLITATREIQIKGSKVATSPVVTACGLEINSPDLFSAQSPLAGSLAAGTVSTGKDSKMPFRSVLRVFFVCLWFVLFFWFYV